MTHEERRRRPEHHVVHDYANLVSSGLLITDKASNDRLLKIAPVNSHVWHAFYMNCRKMYEFFHHQRSKDYLRAQQFVKAGTKFTFQHWTYDVQKFMNTHMLHAEEVASQIRKSLRALTIRTTSLSSRGCGRRCCGT